MQIGKEHFSNRLRTERNLIYHPNRRRILTRKKKKVLLASNKFLLLEPEGGFN
jgi:hypothetical protein